MATPEIFLRRAIELSLENVRTRQGGPFGAVIVREDRIVAEASNTVTATHDPTAHAEVNVIRTACHRLGTHDLAGCTLYSSCEPCPMCLGAIYWAHLDSLVYAAGKEDAAAHGFDDSLIYAELARPHAGRRLRTTQVLREEALSAFRAWQQDEAKTPY